MPVRYDQRGSIGSSMSERAADAYDAGLVPWSKLPAKLRRDFTSEEASFNLHLSAEWHHTSKYANVTYFYWADAVAAFWDELAPYTAKDLRVFVRVRHRIDISQSLLTWRTRFNERFSLAVRAATAINNARDEDRDEDW